MTLEITLKVADTEELAALAFALDMAFDLEDARYEDELNDNLSPASTREMEETYRRLLAMTRLIQRITGTPCARKPRHPSLFKNKAGAKRPPPVAPALEIAPNDEYPLTCKHCALPIRRVDLDEDPIPYASYPHDDANCAHALNHEPAE